ncbi:hypothetical protein LMG28614_05225 [Paraburkholderia ultramafica]|uniref:Uncharacterized protein n=1 Tax=Paraburkholderia ultramafica TaxID=1544867 RepID=A0A6S7CXY0_9BURK|nr:hypothetical protein [Paraburkholderia ultramafica]CAB3800605.1 hypothetical protein LMG28614_05225 [Paraburkholderia ultramafica]
MRAAVKRRNPRIRRGASPRRAPGDREKSHTPLPDASLWILDEPFDAIDVDGLERVNGLIREHVQRGGVLLSSHLEPNIPMLPVRECDLHRYC